MPELSTRTVERALSLLGSVCDAGRLSLADAARAAALSPSTALRLLRTLETAGFLRRDDDGAFRPGLRIVQLGAQALAADSLVSLATPALKRLVAATGESAYLSVLSRAGEDQRTGQEGADQLNGSGCYLAMEEGTHPVRHTSWVGRSIPLAGTAAGTALAGAVPAAGFVLVEGGVEADVTAVAAPVMAGDRVVAALSVVAPSYRVSATQARELGVLVAAEARRLLQPAGPESHDAHQVRTA